MPKKIVSAFAYTWYPVYELRFGMPEVAFEVDAKDLARWKRAFTSFAKAQKEIKEAQATMGDMR